MSAKLSSVSMGAAAASSSSLPFSSKLIIFWIRNDFRRIWIKNAAVKIKWF
jgi:hypothetical protein